MTRRFVVIGEALADLRIATEIADRVIVFCVDWLDESILDSQRTWIVEMPPGSLLTWDSIPNRAREVGIRVHGHFDGNPGLADAKAARRAITYVLREITAVDAIVLIRDTDDQVERRDGLEQARQVFKKDCAIVLGIAFCEREAWVVSGFLPANEEESACLARECSILGFDPCLHSEELTAGKDDAAKRSPKRVLNALTKGDKNREGDCWRQSNLALLVKRGANNGLRDYINEVRTILVPIIAGHEGHLIE